MQNLSASTRLAIICLARYLSTLPWQIFKFSQLPHPCSMTLPSVSITIHKEPVEIFFSPLSEDRFIGISYLLKSSCSIHLPRLFEPTVRNVLTSMYNYIPLKAFLSGIFIYMYIMVFFCLALFPYLRTNRIKKI